MTLKSHTGRMTGKSATHPEQLELMAKAAWRDKGMALLNPKDIHNEYDRQTVVKLANAKYGERK